MLKKRKRVGLKKGTGRPKVAKKSKIRSGTLRNGKRTTKKRAVSKRLKSRHTARKVKKTVAKRRLRRNVSIPPESFIAPPEVDDAGAVYQQGYSETYQEGFNAGFAQGFEDGHKLAYTEPS
ncbi:flagellar biosynthesis/type III secretory pathway protein FliH [Paenibacillus shirakamiensis]|uniref:Flagellar biosynthesis/type III secretory pathway protein FliH n=1 Tax=Paenibacillus shirakamiensis TaxID=1265935 RepID=A0ABS4JK94_9BACL|nr:hypothetical protein [Paenibacillus shirakamiensis]MBP2002133.1 flagellar biosynthesis/type III secretory pathway protein FliH [Paenibacillus shirakamiensis]